VIVIFFFTFSRLFSMITSFFDKIGALTKEQQQNLVRQRAEEEKKEATERRELQRLEEEKDTRKRLRDLESRLAGKGAGRPKKEKLHTPSNTVTVTNSTINGNIIINSPPPSSNFSSSATVTRTSTSSSSNTSSLAQLPLLYASDSDIDEQLQDDESDGEFESDERNIITSIPPSWSSLGFVNSRRINGPKIKRGKYIDWVADYNLFEQIVKCVKRNNSFTEALRELQGIHYPSIMIKLTRGTLHGWFDKNKKLKREIKDRWLARKPAKRGIKKKYALSFEPRLEYLLFKIFKQRREDDLPVNSVIGVSIIKSVITQYKVKLLEEMTLSRRWVRQWLREKCNYSYKRATTSGQKIAPDWQLKVSTMVDRG
jgi:hypothetical protein